ncbi:DUF2254 domain-containing protein [Aureimonas leprariae]|uniref:DUF2254 domain-containing protein n=1 Tax=Plantimonas leprariae TaxID=2615207 RepID=A0A7V7PRJ9_9HYPH|nr:DUF2254 domain-containing protein [Aureimonas leprariae]KAB0681380.1 DUF2254 domain-containing protein [Aureimonas leprariae]
MTSRWLWLLSRITRRIWFRASLFSVLAVATALVGIVASPYIPSDMPTKIGSDAVDNILGIIAASMLTVTTFSLSTMVSAYSAATTNVTPRATQLVMEDRTTHNVLSTFVGSFLYSLVGIIVLSTGAYGERGRVVLFVVTIGVVIVIVATLMRWMGHLSGLGRVVQTTERVEAAATRAMRERHRRPYLGGRPLRDSASEVPRSARAVFPERIGYVQHVDAGALSDVARDDGGRVFLNAIPGDFVGPDEPIAWVEGFGSDDVGSQVRDAFAIGDTRSFDQDPRFGAIVLSEIASRALSPGINDPGTAIDVIGRAVRLLAIWREPHEEEEVEHPNVFVPTVELGDLFDDLFTPIARDGAATVEVGVRLQKAFRSLARLSPERFSSHARRHSGQALERAEAALAVEADRLRLQRLAADV